MSRLDGAGGSSAILIRHFLQVPWPPQVESMAMPFQLAASNRVTPYGTRTARSLKTRLTRTGWVTSSSAVVTWLPGPEIGRASCRERVEDASGGVAARGE